MLMSVFYIFQNFHVPFGRNKLRLKESILVCKVSKLTPHNFDQANVIMIINNTNNNTITLIAHEM